MNGLAQQLLATTALGHGSGYLQRYLFQHVLPFGFWHFCHALQTAAKAPSLGSSAFFQSCLQLFNRLRQTQPHVHDEKLARSLTEMSHEGSRQAADHHPRLSFDYHYSFSACNGRYHNTTLFFLHDSGGPRRYVCREPFIKKQHWRSFFTQKHQPEIYFVINPRIIRHRLTTNCQSQPFQPQAYLSP